MNEFKIGNLKSTIFLYPQKLQSYFQGRNTNTTAKPNSVQSRQGITCFYYTGIETLCPSCHCRSKFSVEITAKPSMRSEEKRV